MAKCTSLQSCETGYMNCDPCPFTSIDFHEGTIAEIDPMINLFVREVDTECEGIVEVLGEMGLYGNEPHQVIEAVKAKQSSTESDFPIREPYGGPQHTVAEIEE